MFYLDNIIKYINNNLYVTGLAVLILNVVSKYVQINLSKTQENFIKSAFTRELLIFTICFTSTRDIVKSFYLTAAFIILSSTVFNEKSNYCLIPNKYLIYEDILDIDGDNKVSKDEISKAKKLFSELRNNNYF
tara:strand:- start:63 stop:461 length:399 start_codon:yes stop_codon:yes gene_type:complete